MAIKLETGQILKGTSTKSYTGKRNIVKIISLGEDKNYAMSLSNGRVYGINGHKTKFEVPESDTVDSKNRYVDERMTTSRIGIEFGDVLPESFKEWYGTDSDMVFIGYHDSDVHDEIFDYHCSDEVFIAVLNASTGVTDYCTMDIEEFDDMLFKSSQKKMTVHYINKKGDKVEKAVDAKREIKDMKEELYVITN